MNNQPVNPLVELQLCGQSFWYDNIRRKFLHDGTIQRLIAEDGLLGITSNPSIFEKAIGSSSDYDEQLAELSAAAADTNQMYEALVLADIRQACDMFAAVYEQTNKRDGFVSLEVSPHLAHDTAATIAEARRLYEAVGRPNVMIKVPATPAGIPAIEKLIGAGINVNITLMFSMAHYEAVAQAYINGLRHWLQQGGDPTQVASVASFFVSRVDTAVDKQLAALDDPAAKSLLGKVAIANSKVVYQRFQEIFHGPVFAELMTTGANVQRLLWASTSTKNPDYPATLYIDELIGPQTVNTMPPDTVDAFRDHGNVAQTLTTAVDQAQLVLDQIVALQIDLEAVTEQLQGEGVAAFAKSFDSLLATIAQKGQQLV
ncbi:MAG: transaldolase [Chloroflexota bacterium]